MSLAELREFEDYLLGALSTLVSEEAWKKALDSARSCWSVAREGQSVKEAG